MTKISLYRAFIFSETLCDKLTFLSTESIAPHYSSSLSLFLLVFHFYLSTFSVLLSTDSVNSDTLSKHAWADSCSLMVMNVVVISQMVVVLTDWVRLPIARHHLLHLNASFLQTVLSRANLRNRVGVLLDVLQIAQRDGPAFGTLQITSEESTLEARNNAATCRFRTRWQLAKSF